MVRIREASGQGADWPSLKEAMAASTAEVLSTETGRPVAYRHAGQWHVDQQALQAAHAVAQDPAVLVLRIVHAREAVPMADVLTAASALGVRPLPVLTDVVEGTIWPTGDRWVAQVGRAGKVIGNDLIPTWTEAVEAARRAIEAARAGFTARLQDAGGLAARLAESRHLWAPPILALYATDHQPQPWQLHLAPHVPVRV
ncbi:MAG: hypothetical protein ACRDZO_03485 [Egibacteraceae bacterium]